MQQIARLNDYVGQGKRVASQWLLIAKKRDLIAKRLLTTPYALRKKTIESDGNSFVQIKVPEKLNPTLSTIFLVVDILFYQQVAPYN
ncbi:MAG: hypothetical protein IPO47_14920 [Bacteroidetes bacterium]|nr:hypothetical protein [Bacteroidota bacterium]